MKNKWNINQWNYHEIVPDTSIGIEQVREIKRLLTTKPYLGGNRLVVLHSLEKATVQAQNALLKVLEEPMDNTYFILTASQKGSILPTVLSRCAILQESENLTADPQMVTKVLELFSLSPGERILLAQENAKTKQDALTLCQNLLSGLQNLLHTTTTHQERPAKRDSPGVEESVKPPLIARTITKVETARRYIEGNINHKATLDILLLGLPNLPKNDKTY